MGPLCVCVCVCAQSCPTLCNPMDCNPPGSSVHGIFQARILEWVAISSSRGSSPPRNRTHVLFHLLYLQADSLPLSYLESFLFLIRYYQVRSNSPHPASSPLVKEQFLGTTALLLTKRGCADPYSYLLWVRTCVLKVSFQ